MSLEGRVSRYNKNKEEITWARIAHTIYNEKIKGEVNIKTFCHLFCNNFLYLKNEEPTKNKVFQKVVSNILDKYYIEYGIPIEK